MAQNRFRECFLLSAVGVLAAAGGFFGISALIDPGRPIPFMDSVHAAPVQLTTLETEQLIDELAAEADYAELPPEIQSTWDIVANALYRKLGAYDLRFELTDNPAKNCVQKIHGSQGGCYHGNGEYESMIFISPAIDGLNAEFIAYHEYSHHLQHIEGKPRFVENIECDADLRAVELMGGWSNEVFQRRCEATGLTLDELMLDKLPVLEVKLASTRS